MSTTILTLETDKCHPSLLVCNASHSGHLVIRCARAASCSLLLLLPFGGASESRRNDSPKAPRFRGFPVPRGPQQQRRRQSCSDATPTIKANRGQMERSRKGEQCVIMAGFRLWQQTNCCSTADIANLFGYFDVASSISPWQICQQHAWIEIITAVWYL